MPAVARLRCSRGVSVRNLPAWSEGFQEGQEAVGGAVAARRGVERGGAGDRAFFLGHVGLMTPEGGSQEHPVLGYDPALGKVTLR